MTQQEEYLMIAKYIGQKIDIVRPDRLLILNSTMSDVEREIDYKSDWNQLMPVVAKIREDWDVNISHEISITYLNVVTFLKELNEPNENQVLGQSTII